MKNTTVRQYLSITIVQFLNLLVPLFLIPLVVRQIGPSSFGIISFAQTFATFFLLAIVYSFEYTATKEIIINKNNSEKVSEIFNDVLTAKFLIFLASLIIFSIICIFSKTIRQNILIQIISFSVNIGYVLYPLWFFQGIQKLPVSLFFNLIARLLMAASVLLFLGTKSLFWIYPLSYSVSQIVLGIGSMIYIKKYLGVNIQLSSLKKGFQKIYSGFNIFISLVMLNLYQNINLFLVAFFTTDLITGYYASSTKLVLVVLGVAILPLSMVLFPKISTSFQISYEKGIHALKTSLWVASFVGLIMSGVLFIFPHLLIGILFGKNFLPAVPYLKILAFIPFINCVSNIFSIQGLINLNYKKVYLVITSISLLICVIGILIFAKKYTALAAAYSWLAAELFTLIGSFLFLSIKKIQLVDLSFLYTIIKDKKFNYD